MARDDEKDIKTRDRNQVIGAFAIALFSLFILGMGIALLAYWLLQTN